MLERSAESVFVTLLKTRSGSAVLEGNVARIRNNTFMLGKKSAGHALTVIRPVFPYGNIFSKKKFSNFQLKKKFFFFDYFCSYFEVKYSLKKISEIRHLHTKKKRRK
jgi:hypothetical protein